ncbi:MAG TPA: hypothetical protein VJT71_01855 [Pyrinomonadaceae bacterium]|nr:hypothetical protein [Pyrinomonadaceae bacterium]
MGIPTQINVRVVAKFGKYLGDDIGGALITIRDVHTRELLAQGTTSGGSGIKKLMGIPVTRAQVLTTEEASVFTATLDLDQPRLVKVTAHGPLAAQRSANTVSLTQWVYPGRNVNGFLMEIPGLVVQILNPPTHFLPSSAPAEIEIRANVTMMCGCPIENAPWTPDLFEVTALIKRGEFYSLEFPLSFDQKAPDGIPSQFFVTWPVPGNETQQPEIYEITVFAFQQETGNTGVDKVTVIIPAAS